MWFFLFFPEKKTKKKQVLQIMQIVSNGDSWENKKTILNLLSAELDQKVVKVKSSFRVATLQDLWEWSDLCLN